MFQGFSILSHTALDHVCHVTVSVSCDVSCDSVWRVLLAFSLPIPCSQGYVHVGDSSFVIDWKYLSRHWVGFSSLGFGLLHNALQVTFEFCI